MPNKNAFAVFREEIRDTIVMTLAVCGVTGVTQCLVPALEAYDSAQLPA